MFADFSYFKSFILLGCIKILIPFFFGVVKNVCFNMEIQQFYLIEIVLFKNVLYYCLFEILQLTIFFIFILIQTFLFYLRRPLCFGFYF